MINVMHSESGVFAIEYTLLAPFLLIFFMVTSELLVCEYQISWFYYNESVFEQNTGSEISPASIIDEYVLPRGVFLSNISITLYDENFNATEVKPGDLAQKLDILSFRYEVLKLNYTRECISNSLCDLLSLPRNFYNEVLYVNRHS